MSDDIDTDLQRTGESLLEWVVVVVVVVVVDDEPLFVPA